MIGSILLMIWNFLALSYILILIKLTIEPQDKETKWLCPFSYR